MSKIKLTENQYKRLKNNLIESSILNEQTSDQVMQVQKKLNSCFNAGLTPDGIMGPKTKNAIENFTSYKFSTTYVGIK